MDTSPPRLIALGDLIGDLETLANERWQAKLQGTPLGPRTALPALDSATGGYLPAGLIQLLGGSGSGKSALAQQIAGTCGVPAMLISMEMPPVELLLRHVARCTDTFMGKLKSATDPMNPREFMALVQRAVREAPQLYLVDARTAWPDADWIVDAAERARGADAHVLVVIDSLHSWAHSKPGRDMGEYDALNDALVGALSITARLHGTVLLVGERNRASKEAGGISSGAGSRRIEYSAEMVIDLVETDDGADQMVRTKSNQQAGKVITANGSPTREVCAILRKNRHGSANVGVDLTFDPRVMRFSETGSGAVAKAKDWF